MKQFKLHLQIPEESANHWGKIAAWKEENNKLMDVLTTKMDLVHESFLAGTELTEMYSQREIKDLCLQAYGSDWPSQVDKVASLMLLGNGDCPFCGCDQITEITGGYEPSERDGDPGGFRVIGYRCDNCHTEFNKEDR